MPVRLHVWGDLACFTRPEFKAERVSYDVMTPAAARGILEAIHWKPAIAWHIERIHVLKPIRFRSFLRNEVSEKASVGKALAAMRKGTTEGLGLDILENRQQRLSRVLVDVAYVIDAHFSLTHLAGTADQAAAQLSMFKRRARRGQFFHAPYLGNREFAASFQLLEKNDPMPTCQLANDKRDVDLGWMLHDIDYTRDNRASFYDAHLRGGVMEVPPLQDANAAR